MIIRGFDYSLTNWYGSYISDETSNVGYIPIAKNASSYMRKFVSINFNWTKQYDYKLKEKQTYIVILRDPFQRWISGVAEYFMREHKDLNIDNQTILQFVSKRVILDTHTEPQVNFLQNLHTHNIVFFKFDKKLYHNLSNYAIKNNLSDNLSDPGLINDTGTNPEKNKLQNIIKKFITNNPKYVPNIKKLYESDYNLINRVKFYEAN